jgi:nucleotide-binding universal stress UspA family protein
VRILVALDHSDRDRLAIHECARLAKATNGVAMLVTVVPNPRSLLPGPVREAQAYLQIVQSGLLDQGVTAETMVLKGDPADEITRIAHQLEVDVVILVTRGRRGFMLSSTTEAVLSNSRAPILLINESTRVLKYEDEVSKQSTYVATMLWQRKMRGACSEHDAIETIERLATEGLNRDIMFATLRELAKKEADVDMLDLDFQLRTLRRFLPEEVEGVGGSVKPDADVA